MKLNEIYFSRFLDLKISVLKITKKTVHYKSENTGNVLTIKRELFSKYFSKSNIYLKNTLKSTIRHHKRQIKFLENKLSKVK